MNKTWMISTAHNFAQALPLSENKLICLRCGFKKKIGESGQKCIPHGEFVAAGYKE